MAKQILIPGVKASEKKDIDNNASASTRKTTKTTKSKKAKKESVDKNIEKELEKMDNAPKQINTDAVVDNDKVQIDLSSVFGPGAYAEIDPDEQEKFIEENNIKTDAPNTTETTKEESAENINNNEKIEGTSNQSDNEIDPVILKSGNPKCYAYLSLKATGVYKPDIISFALVTEEGKAFYAEFKDIDIMKITPDVLVNIVQKRFNLKTDDIVDGRIAITGDDKCIRSKLIKWIREEFTYKGYVMQIISDKVINEFGLFMEFLLNGIPMNQYLSIVSPVCIDLNTILADSIDIGSNENMNDEEFIRNYIPAYIATNISRFSITGDNTPEEYLGNALVNAQAIRAAFRRLYNLDKDEEHIDIINKK